MRVNPDYALSDPDEVARLVREHPFVTLVSPTSAGLVASHYPVLVERDRDPLTLLGHVGRPDERTHELGRHEVLVVVQGPDGYVSPSWYAEQAGPAVPTWNFLAAHLWGTPELLDPAANRAALGALVDAMEDRVETPRRISGSTRDADYADRISGGTVGFRLRVRRWEAKRKLSQDKPAQVVEGVIDGLEGPGPYADPTLAEAMRRERARAAQPDPNG